MARPKAAISLDEYEEPTNYLIYADSGSGKTPLGASAAEMLGDDERLLIMAVEKGAISAKKWVSAAAQKRVDIVPCDTYEQFMELMDWLEANPYEYQWVLLDSLTQLQEIAGVYSMQQRHERNPRVDLLVWDKPDYLKAQNIIKDTVRRLNDLAPNVIYTAQLMWADNEEGEPMCLPLLQGGKDGRSFSMKIVGHVPVVGRLDVVTKENKETKAKETYRVFRTIRTPTMIARDRFEGVGDLRDPTMQKIERRVKRSIAEMAARKEAELASTPPVPKTTRRKATA